MAPLSDNARGALWMMVSMAGFVLNDTLMKSVSGEVPLFQAIFLRGMIATTLICLLAWQRGALARLPRGRTTIIIAHRLATIRSADLIVAMEKGRAVEAGRHDQLIARGGYYARVSRLQGAAIIVE